MFLSSNIGNPTFMNQNLLDLRMQDITCFWNFHSEGVTSVFDRFLHSQQQVKDGTLEVHYLVQVLQGTQLSLKGEMEKKKKKLFHSRIQKMQGLQFAAKLYHIGVLCKAFDWAKEGNEEHSQRCLERVSCVINAFVAKCTVLWQEEDVLTKRMLQVRPRYIFLVAANQELFFCMPQPHFQFHWEKRLWDCTPSTQRKRSKVWTCNPIV